MTVFLNQMYLPFHLQLFFPIQPNEDAFIQSYDNLQLPTDIIEQACAFSDSGKDYMNTTV